MYATTLNDTFALLDDARCQMVGSCVLHYTHTCETYLRWQRDLSRSLPSIWEKINEWRRRRQHSLDAVHATDNDNDRRPEGGQEGSRLVLLSLVAWAVGWLAGITRKGIVAKLPSIPPSFSAASAPVPCIPPSSQHAIQMDMKFRV